MVDRRVFVEIGDEHGPLDAADVATDGNNVPYLTQADGSLILATYATLAAAIADTANLFDGQYVIIQGGDEFATGFTNADRGIWSVDSNQGAANTDYTKQLDVSDHASEVEIGDAGGFFTGSDVEAALQEIGTKQIAYKRADTSLFGVNVSGTSTTAFDAAITALVLDSGALTDTDGVGDTVTNGVIINATRAHKLPIRDAANNDAIDDGSGNEVYARLTNPAGTYVVEFYSDVAGVETAYDFTVADDIDLAYVWVSMDLMLLPALAGITEGEFFGDQAGVVGVIDDANVATNNPAFTDLLTGLGTQEAVNEKVDDLGSTANGDGASLIGIEDAAGNFTATDVEGALTELAALVDADQQVIRFYNNTAAAAAAADATWEIGDIVVISGDAGNEGDRGIWEVTANTGTDPGDTFPGDYTKRLDVSHTASEVLIADGTSYYTGGNVETALDELAAAIGGADSTTRDYSSNVYVADNDDLVTAIGKLDAAISAAVAPHLSDCNYVAAEGINATTSGPQLVAMTATGRNVELANASNTGTNTDVVGFATGADYVSTDDIDQGDCLVSDGVLSGFTGLTIGATYYADPSTEGAITDTKPSTRGEWILPVGVAISATELYVELQPAVEVAGAGYSETVIWFRDTSTTADQGIGENGFSIDEGELWLDNDVTVQNPAKSGTGRYTLYVCTLDWSGTGAAVTTTDISDHFTPIGKQN